MSIKTWVLQVYCVWRCYQSDSIFKFVSCLARSCGGVLFLKILDDLNLVFLARKILSHYFRYYRWFSQSKFSIDQRIRNLRKLTRSFVESSWLLLQMSSLGYTIQSSLLFQNTLKNLRLFWFTEFISDTVARAWKL